MAVGIVRSSRVGTTLHSTGPLPKVLLCAMALGMVASIGQGQWLEKVIYLPDSLSGVLWPSCIASNPDAHKIYVSGEYDGGTRNGLDAYVIVVDARTTEKVARIAVQENVAALCYNPVVKKLYATHRECETGLISVIDGFSDTVVATVVFDSGPHLLCCNTVNGKMYVASELTDNSMAVFDGVGDSVIRTVPMQGDQRRLVFDSVGNKVYCARVGVQKGGAVLVVDGAGDTVLSDVPVGSSPVDLAVSTRHRRLYCYGWGGYEGTLFIVDSDGDSVLGMIPAGSAGSENGQVLCVNERRGEIYFPGIGDTVLALDCAGDTIARRFALGPGYEAAVSLCLPEEDLLFCYTIEGAAVRLVDLETGMVVSTDTMGENNEEAFLADTVEGRFYCVNSWDNDVTVLSVTGDSITSSRVVVGSRPRTLCWASRGNKIYVGDARSGLVYVLDCASDRVRALRLPGPHVSALCYDSLDNKVYCAAGAESVHVIDCATDSVVAAVRTEEGPRALIYNPLRNRVYSANTYSRSLTVIDCRTDSAIAKVALGPTGAKYTLQYNPQRDELLIARHWSPDFDIEVVDCATNRLVGKLPYGAFSILYHRALGKLYAVGINPPVAVLDAASDSLVATIPGVIGLSGCANETDGKVYTAYAGFGSLVAVVDAKADTLTSVISSIVNPYSVTHDVLNDKVYITSGTEPGRVFVLDGPTDSIVDSISVLGHRPRSAVWSQSDGRVYIGNLNSGSVSVVRDSMVPGMQDAVAIPRRHGSGTVVRQLSFPAGLRRADVYDVSGRRVARLRLDSGRAGLLAPGVYFVREEQAQVQAQAIRKVIITR